MLNVGGTAKIYIKWTLGYIHMGMISSRYRMGLIFGMEKLTVDTGPICYRTSFRICSHGNDTVSFRSILHTHKQKKICYIDKFQTLLTKK